jgi:hypothetical protein
MSEYFLGFCSSKYKESSSVWKCKTSLINSKSISTHILFTSCTGCQLQGVLRWNSVMTIWCISAARLVWDAALGRTYVPTNSWGCSFGNLVVAGRGNGSLVFRPDPFLQILVRAFGKAIKWSIFEPWMYKSENFSLLYFREYWPLYSEASLS